MLGSYTRYKKCGESATGSQVALAGPHVSEWWTVDHVTLFARLNFKNEG